jgi:uncharacterized membrane-anchored protein
MAGEREWVLRTGEVVLLRTAPVDPDDPMRGEYVRLDYEIGSVPKALCRDGIAAWFDGVKPQYHERSQEHRVYASVKLDGEGVGQLTALSDQKPAEGVFLRGWSGTLYPQSLDVRYGIEAFFMQQGKARALETQLRGEKAGVPLDMEVAVSSSGLAVLKEYRWEPLGLTVVLDPNPNAGGWTAANQRRGIRGLTIELKNHGDTPQAVVAAPGAFRLIPAQQRWAATENEHWTWVGENLPLGKITPADVLVLAPHTSFHQHIDLTLPAWFVQKHSGEKSAEPVSIESLVTDWSASFRIEYAPPTAEDSVALPHAEIIRHASIRSRRFSATAGVD